MTESTFYSRRFTPLLAPLLQDRKWSAVMAVLAAAQLTAALEGWPGWPCPFLHATGVPCPGCGLSRASAAILRGHPLVAMKMHAFAPLLLLTIGMIFLAALLPSSISRRLTAIVSRFERTTGFSQMILILLIFYWFLRLWYDYADMPR